MAFYKEKYDAIVVGGALAGMAAALTLANKGKSVLVLERHNLPGGLTTSFVRGGTEMEATLHEMMSIGPEEAPFKIRTFLEEMGVKVNWLRVPEAYRLVVPKEKIDITLHAGFSGSTQNNVYVPGDYVAAKEIDKQYPGTFSEVNRLLNLCTAVFNAVNYLSINHMSKAQMLLKFPEFVKTCGYSTDEVFATFNLPSEVIDILKAYWIYVGSPTSELPFTIYAVLMADYLGGGSYVAKEFSHELSVRMVEACRAKGVQYEYCQDVDKILVKNGHVYGVRTKRGDEIHADYVACSAYPNRCYGNMIEPKSEVPPIAFKSANFRKMGVTCTSVVLTLDKSPEELNIKDYSVFSSETDMDLDAHWKNLHTKGPYNYLTTICLNYANPSCVPEGQTSLSITTLPLPSAYMDVKPNEYHALKRKVARSMIETVSKHLGVNLFDHILEVEVEMPHTIAHYTSNYLGGIYGYQHDMEDHIVARLQMSDDENYIKGLSFCGAHAISGDGMSPCITNGRKAAKILLDQMSEEGR
ncbi:MAG: NAD(P)/FAD-dependent oxidoreductase [Bacilli bacterium]|nr:NAD(P)/FAD-dependent oxidoreductase [Bacilli bacterium]